jgi:hypothetical protein
MPEQKFHKGQIATEQLRTAIFLFLTGRDPSSVITLAGAASAILEQLARNAGQTPFIDFARNIATARGIPTPARAKYRRYVNDRLGINDHKHMSSESPESLEIDLQKSAEDAIGKAIADYVPVYGREHDFIQAYLQWAWVNRDGAKIMRDYEKLPARVKRR